MHLTDVLAAFETMIIAVKESWNECNAAGNPEIQALQQQVQASLNQLTSLPQWDVPRVKEAIEEVHTVVNATEKATTTIMEQAEGILNADAANPETYSTCVTDAVMQIFEACSFQDITGQRLARVTEILGDMEEQARLTMSVIASNAQGAQNENLSDRDQRKQDLMLHGPANEGEGISQDDIDALFD